MLYQLPNGKTVKLTEEQYFNMSDVDLKYLQGSDTGYTVDDPFYDSVLDDYVKSEILSEFELPKDLEEIPEDYKEKDTE